MCAASSGTADKTLVVILGPTAVGKTQTAISLAKNFRSQIISADSRQFFKELRIGSAMPSAGELKEVPHHFVGQLSVSDHYNVSRFETDALKKIEEIFSNDDIAFMCGGSGLYIDAVCHGIDELPDPDPGIRENLNEQLKVNGIQSIRTQLLQLDPDYYKTIDLNNPVRIIRALEICIITGKPYSSLRTGKPKDHPFKVIKIGLELPKEELMDRIRRRTMAMISAGLEKEARELYPLRHLNALKTVGYNEMFAFFDGQYTYEETAEKIITNTWRYAKRQLTWFRRDKKIKWFHPSDLEGIKKEVLRP